MMQNNSGIVFDIKRFAVHDGPGIRQTIFLKGCPLACWWCHNPESQSVEIQHFRKNHFIDGRTTQMQQAIGTRMSVAGVMQSIEKDVLFFDESGGGVTFSGGEPFVQHGFFANLLKACKFQEIHTTVDTCGHVSPKVFQRLSPHIDLFLFDVKHLNDKIHKQNTGVDTQLIKENLLYLFRQKKQVILRFPLIPDVNSDVGYVEQFILYFTDYITDIQSVDILLFHKIGAHKYERVGKTQRMLKHRDISTTEIQRTKKMLTQAGFRVNTS